MEEGLLVGGGGGGGGGKRESRPLLLKLGLALALSIAGYVASQFHPKPTRLPPPKSSPDDEKVKDSSGKSPRVAAQTLRDELHILTSEALAKNIKGTSSFSINTTMVAKEEEGFITPDFDDNVVSEFEADPEKNPIKAPLEVDFEFEEREEMKREIAYLRNLVEALKERERSLEIQMVEYHGLKEREASLRELENRLKVNAMESKMFNLKIESLQADNQKLRAQLSDYPKIQSELVYAREEIKHLKERLRVDSEQAKEKLAGLHQRITSLLDQERKLVDDDVEVEMKMRRLKELEDEVTDLREVNSRLVEENLKFVELLESTKSEASLNANTCEVQALEEAKHLKEENEELKIQIEQLQTDRCADVEELVYLKWVNACLRYELRNYQPPLGKTIARDLSRCLSPESEKRAKQLILEYGNTDPNEKHISLYDFDTESCSSSPASSEDQCSGTSCSGSTSTKNSTARKSKLVSKLKKLVLGKGKHGSKTDSTDGTTTSCANAEQRGSVSPQASEYHNGRRNSSDSVSSCISMDHPKNQWHFRTGPHQRPPRPSLDVQRTRQLELEAEESIAVRSRSDLGQSTAHGHMRMVSEDSLSSLDHEEDTDGREKARLKKFADVLKGSRGGVAKRRLTTFS